MLADKPTELSRIKLKTWTRQPVPMISEHSAHLTPLKDFRTWLWRYTYLLLLISMLWHRQAIFKSKGDKLCSSAECRITSVSDIHLPFTRRIFSNMVGMIIRYGLITHLRKPNCISEINTAAVLIRMEYLMGIWHVIYVITLISWIVEHIEINVDLTKFVEKSNSRTPALHCIYCNK